MTRSMQKYDTYPIMMKVYHLTPHHDGREELSLELGRLRSGVVTPYLAYSVYAVIASSLIRQRTFISPDFAGCCSSALSDQAVNGN